MLATCSCIAVGLFSIFSTKGASLLIVLIGPFVCRLAYESAMLFIIMAKRTIDINNRLKTIAPDSGEDAFGGIDTSGLKSVVSKAANAAGQKLQQAAQAAEKPAEKAPAHLAPESKPGDTGADSDTDSAE